MWRGGSGKTGPGTQPVRWADFPLGGRFSVPFPAAAFCNSPVLLIQHADSGAGLQCADGAAGHSNAQVGSSQSGVHRAHSLACQHCHLCGGSIGVGSGQTGSLADAASHVIGNAGHKALGIHDGDHRHAEGIAQAHKAGSLGYAVVAQLLAGCHNAHGVAADGCKCGVNRLTKACVQLHSAVLIDHSGSGLCRLGTGSQNSAATW